MEIHDISDKDFKIAILKILNEMQKNTDKQVNALNKQINEQNEYFKMKLKFKNMTYEKSWY